MPLSHPHPCDPKSSRFLDVTDDRVSQSVSSRFTQARSARDILGGTRILNGGTVALNDKQVIHAKPKQKPYKLGDSGGFYLYVLVSGFTSWRFKCRFAGREKRLICASYPEVGLERARELRDDAGQAKKAGKVVWCTVDIGRQDPSPAFYRRYRFSTVRSD